MPVNKAYETGEAEGAFSQPPPLPIPRSLASVLRFQVGISFFAFILIGANDAALGVLLPSLQVFYGIDKSTVGLMFVAGISGYLISALGSGLIVEWLGRRAYMLLGCASFAFGTSMMALALPFPVVVMGSTFIGFGVAAIDAGLNAYIAGLPNSTATLNYLHAFFGVGALLGPLVATGVLKVGWAWYVVYYLWVLVCILLFLGFMVAFKDDRAERERHASRPKGSEGNVMMAMLRLPVVWLAAIFLFVYVGLEVSLGTWVYSFLVEARGDPIEFSGVAVSGYWLGLTIGRLAMGKLGARLGSRRLINICLAGVVFGVLIVWLLPFAPLEAIGLWVVGFSLGPIFPTAISLMSGVVSARLLPGVIGFMAGLGAMGAAIFPASAGALAQLFGLWSLLPFEIALVLISVLIWLRLQARVPSEDKHDPSTTV